MSCFVLQAATRASIRANVLFLPTPHPVALATKFEVAFAHELMSSPDGAPWFRVLLGDIVRLNSAQARPGE
ncbi:MAG TPA: hypothetical protein VEW26_15685 [Allosphingosinicella sp.]|nr:hypothetical protein [Allosphingosinicella sp.]